MYSLRPNLACKRNVCLKVNIYKNLCFFKFKKQLNFLTVNKDLLIVMVNVRKRFWMLQYLS